VQISQEKCITSKETKLLHQKCENIRDKTKPRTRQTDLLIVQLREEGIEILSSQLERHTVVAWIWCRTQTALEHTQELYESNMLREIFFEIIRPSDSIVINIDTNQFKKTVGKFLRIH